MIATLSISIIMTNNLYPDQAKPSCKTSQDSCKQKSVFSLERTCKNVLRLCTQVSSLDYACVVVWCPFQLGDMRVIEKGRATKIVPSRGISH